MKHISVVDHRRHQNEVRTSVTTFCFYHILTVLWYLCSKMELICLIFYTRHILPLNQSCLIDLHQLKFCLCHHPCVVYYFVPNLVVRFDHQRPLLHRGPLGTYTNRVLFTKLGNDGLNIPTAIRPLCRTTIATYKTSKTKQNNKMNYLTLF